MSGAYKRLSGGTTSLFLCGRGFESTEGHFSTLNFWFLLENAYATTKVGQKGDAFSKW